MSDGMAITNFSVAIDRPVRQGKEKQTDYPKVNVFGKQAENCKRYLKKGSLIGIQGRLQTGKYTNRDGATVYTTEVYANNVEFLEWGEKLENSTNQKQKNDFPAISKSDIPFR